MYVRLATNHFIDEPKKRKCELINNIIFRNELKKCKKFEPMNLKPWKNSDKEDKATKKEDKKSGKSVVFSICANPGLFLFIIVLSTIRKLMSTI